MLGKILLEKIRHYYIGNEQQFIFKEVHSVKLPKIKEIDFYVHIPFCKNMCPYCPYNKIKYDKKLVKPFLDSILKEIEQYSTVLGKINVPSIYIGGGTPTNIIDELGIIINHIKDNFRVAGDIAIETNPNDVNETVAKNLKEYDVSLISLGVQSFDDKYLRLIGRNYKAEILKPVIDLLLKNDFKTLNVDLMFALPGQSNKDVLSDIKKAMDLGANQITTYPLFTFPYSKAGEYIKLKKIKMPNLINRRKMYKTIHDYCLKQGFERVSVWGFKKGHTPKFSSVTRDQYIGFGPGAGTYLGDGFYFNTFSVNDYIDKCLNNKFPIALKLDVTEKLSKYYWLYWRLYDTYVPKKQLWEIFDKNDKKLKRSLTLTKLLKMYEEDENFLTLTERGCFWIHLAQNYFVLNYINKVWYNAMKNPWPTEIKI